MTRVLVTGGRDFANIRILTPVLCAILKEHPDMIIIHGGCKNRDRATGAMIGADWLADCWAAAYEVDCYRFPARWKAQGKPAGPIRNQRMLDEGKPDLVVAFPGGAGIEDMKRRARVAGITVQEVEG